MIVRKCPKCGRILASEMSGKPHPHGEMYGADRYDIPSADHYLFVKMDQAQRQRYLDGHAKLNLDRKSTWLLTVVVGRHAARDRREHWYDIRIERLRARGVSRDAGKRMAWDEALRRHPGLAVKSVKAEEE